MVICVIAQEEEAIPSDSLYGLHRVESRYVESMLNDFSYLFSVCLPVCLCLSLSLSLFLFLSHFLCHSLLSLSLLSVSLSFSVSLSISLSISLIPSKMFVKFYIVNRLIKMENTYWPQYNINCTITRIVNIIICQGWQRRNKTCNLP